jgi:hypothetical protein
LEKSGIDARMLIRDPAKSEIDTWSPIYSSEKSGMDTLFPRSGSEKSGIDARMLIRDSAKSEIDTWSPIYSSENSEMDTRPLICDSAKSDTPFLQTQGPPN